MYVTGLFWRIHLIDLFSSLVSFVLVTIASTYLVALAYKNTKFVLKHKVNLIPPQTTVVYIRLLIVIKLTSYHSFIRSQSSEKMQSPEK